MKTLPRLLAYTDQRVSGLTDFERSAAALTALGEQIGLVARLPGSPANQLAELVISLESMVAPSQSWLLVSGRADLAAISGAGLILRQGDLFPDQARSLVGRENPILASVHSTDQARRALDQGADGLVVGTIWATPSHPGRGGAGLSLIEATAALGAPVWAIGGVTPERAVEAHQAGAWGTAVIRGIWDSNNPGKAALALTLPWKAT